MESNSTISDFYMTKSDFGYYAIDSNGESYSFYGGQIYKFEVEPFKNATYKTLDGFVTIPIEEFSNNFMTEKDNFEKLEEKLDKGCMAIGGSHNIYGTYINPHMYRIFINAYPVKDDDGEWILPENAINTEKPMFSFDTGAFSGCSLIDKHPDKPVKLGLEPNVYAVRQQNVSNHIHKEYESKIRRLEEKIKSGLTLKDYLKSFKNRNFSYCRGKGKRGATTDIRFGKYPKYVRIQFVRYFDGYRYGFTVETNENIYFFDIKHEYKWRPYFHKQKNDHTKCAL